MQTTKNEPRTINEFIQICAERGVVTPDSGLPYAEMTYPKDFGITGMPTGDLDALSADMLGRYRDGILLDSDRQVSLMCNFAHKHGVPARELLDRVVADINSLGEGASEYQQRTRENVLSAIERIDSPNKAA